MFSPSAESDAGAVALGDTFRFVRCEDCGLIYLNPRVEPEQLEVYYPDYYLPYRGPAAWGRFAGIAEKGLRITDRKRSRRVRRALRRVAEESGDRKLNVLDVGCGKPSFLATLRDSRPELGLTGIDFVSSGWESEQGHDRREPVHSKAVDSNDRWHGLTLIEAEPADYEPEPGSEPDVITMWHYLEHDYTPRRTLEAMRKIAHPGTRLMIEVPDFNSLPRLLYGKNWEGYHAPRHTAIYTRNTLAAILEASGWEVIHYTTGGTLDMYALWWMSAMERRGIDWSSSMEPRFLPFMLGRILTAPLFTLAHIVPLGVQLVTARPRTA